MIYKENCNQLEELITDKIVTRKPSFLNLQLPRLSVFKKNAIASDGQLG